MSPLKHIDPGCFDMGVTCPVSEFTCTYSTFELPGVHVLSVHEMVLDDLKLAPVVMHLQIFQE